MSIYFGTDGIRGVVNSDLGYDIAFKCGNALTSIVPYPSVLIGRDTRVSGEMLTASFCSGVVVGGGSVIDIGVATTPTISYLTQKYKCDFGIVISASHNPSEFNGIKVFDCNGIKILQEVEEKIETQFGHTNIVSGNILGSYCQKLTYWKQYADYLASTVTADISGLKIVIDGSNGAGYKSAPYVFRKLGAEVITINCHNNGLNINNNCGSLYPQSLQKAVIKHKADMGFALDGDGDRIVAVDNKGKIVDGDQIIYMLAKYYKAKGCLTGDAVVGTTHTNMGIERALRDRGVKLLRSDIGDKYVKEMMDNNHLVLGGEQSGHIILGNYVLTGDGTLAALHLAQMVVDESKKLSELNDAKLYPQTNINIKVKDKHRVLNNQTLLEESARISALLGAKGRVYVRASGTEPKIRIMVECFSKRLSDKYAKQLESVVNNLNM